MNWRIPVLDIYRICSENLIHYPLESGGIEFAISEDGLSLLENIGESNHKLGRIDLLQLIMAIDDRLTTVLKRQLLFGLLLSSRSGLYLVKEDGIIIAPSPEILVACPLRGEIRFRDRITSAVPTEPPDLESLCGVKVTGVIPVREIVWFILTMLKSLDPQESLSTTFRLKSYSSVMNKLFYRGKRLTDLFATSDEASNVVALQDMMKEKGAMNVSSHQDYLNGNNCVVYRYVRILDVTIFNPSSIYVQPHSFSFCVYYEIVTKNQHARVPHQQYELERLEFGVSPGSQNNYRSSTSWSWKFIMEVKFDIDV